MSGRDGRERWVGRSIRRVEDFSLVTGRGRFTADLVAAHWVRFVRSPVAAGTIENITAPQGATVITAVRSASNVGAVSCASPRRTSKAGVPARSTSCAWTRAS